MTTDEYVPSWGEVRSAYVSHYLTDQLRRGAEFDRFLARVRRDAARGAIDGLSADAEIDVRLGVEGGDSMRVQNAEAVIDAATIYRDTEYPEESP